MKSLQIKSLAFYCFVLIIGQLLLCGCGFYKFNDISPLPADVKTVRVQSFTFSNASAATAMNSFAARTISPRCVTRWRPGWARRCPPPSPGAPRPASPWPTISWTDPSGICWRRLFPTTRQRPWDSYSSRRLQPPHTRLHSLGASVPGSLHY